MKRRLQEWRPLTLCWARPVRPAASSIAHRVFQTTHRHHHSAVHLHFALTVQQRAERATSATAQLPKIGTATRLVHATHTEHGSRTLNHVRTNTSHVQRESTSTLDRRIEHVHTSSTTSVLTSPAHRASETSSAARRVSIPRAQEITSPPPRPRARALITFAMLPKESRAAAPAQLTARKATHAPATPASLVWRKPPSPAEQLEAKPDIDADGVQAPARTTGSPPAATAPLPTITPQQAREAVRANLLDGAVADRLADDVIRRVEKRLRIERERRGL